MPDRDPLFDISGKVILIAGAAGGIGRAFAEALHERGARLILSDSDPDRLAAVMTQATENVARTGLDITDAGSIRAAIAFARDRFGVLDGVVNAAGVAAFGPAMELDEDAFRRSLDINLTGAFLLSREAAKVLPDGGRIVHLASVSSFVANANYAAYASSKAGLAQLIRVLAREWASRGICVNAIGPAVIETDLSRPYLDDPAYRKNALASIPMGRLSVTDDLMGTLVLLLAPGGAFITGQTIYVDGGRTTA